MIKRERKDTHSVALSVPISLNNTTATQLRNDLINARHWLNQNYYKKQFKKNDTKNALDAMSSTCVFCQQKLTIATGNEDARSVEHFRPKAKYWWLAHSWDNLFTVCMKCNTKKDNNFECLNPQITNIRTNDLANIHNLAADYQVVEQPRFLHPELDIPENHLKYELNGKIENDGSDRGKYTIDTCQLDRLDLRGKRKRIFDTFDEKVSLILFDGSKSNAEKQNEILKNYFDFQTDAQVDRNEFSGFKRFIFKKYFRGLIKEYVSLLQVIDNQ